MPQVAYQRILQLTYVDELLLALKTLFIKLFQPFLATFVASLHVTSSAKLSSSSAPAASWIFHKAFEGWDGVFDKLLRGLEDKAAQVRISRCPLYSSRGTVMPVARGMRSQKVLGRVTTSSFTFI